MEIKLENINCGNKLVDVTYNFKESTITSIIGRGRSDLAFLLMNKFNRYSGKIYIDGNDNYDMYDCFKRIGYVPGNPERFFVCELVRDEIAFELRQYNYKVDEIDEKVSDALEMIGLSSSIMNRKIMDLSTGEKVRVSFVSALVMNPEVLILDSITNHLDSNSKDNLLKLLLRLKNKFDKTIIFISDDMDFVYSLGNDYILMDEGRIIKSSKVGKWKYDDEMFEKYNLKIPKVLELIGLISLRRQKNLKNIKNIDDIVKGVMINNG